MGRGETRRGRAADRSPTRLAREPDGPSFLPGFAPDTADRTSAGGQSAPTPGGPDDDPHRPGAPLGADDGSRFAGLLQPPPASPKGERKAAGKRAGAAPAADGDATRPAAGGGRRAENPNAGHRERLRSRFEEGGAAALADYEFVELFLFRTIPRGDTKGTAKALLKRFGTFAGVLAASDEALRAVPGVGPQVVHDFRLVRAAVERAAREEVMEAEVLSSWEAVVRYCRIAMAQDTRERFRVLFLDKKNRLVADEVQGVGTVDHTPVYPREVVARALKLSASAVVLVHNHPSGDPSPSKADVDMTLKLSAIAEPLGIRVHDHLIIGKSGTASLRSLGLM